MSDDDFIARLRSRDEAAWNEFYEDNYKRVLGFSRNLGPGAPAEDITQGTFMKAWVSIAIVYGGSLYSWLCKIAINEFLDGVRKANRAREAQPRIAKSDIAEVEFDPIREERDRLLLEAISRLPSEQAVVLQRQMLNDESYKEIQKDIPYPERRLRVSVHRAKKRLKKIIESDPRFSSLKTFPLG